MVTVKSRKPQANSRTGLYLHSRAKYKHVHLPHKLKKNGGGGGGDNGNGEINFGIEEIQVERYA